VTAGLVLLVGAGAAIGESAGAQTLSITAVGVSDFTPVTLDGTAQTTMAAIDNFTVSDTRAVNDGWNVAVQATQFKEWNGTGYVAEGNTLPTGSMSMPAPTVAARDTPSPPPVITQGPYVIDGATVKIASASAETGVGTFDFTQTGPLSLTVPARAYAATYRSEITVSVSSGP